MQKNRILLSLGLLAALSVGLIWFGLAREVSPDSNAAPVSQAVPPTRCPKRTPQTRRTGACAWSIPGIPCPKDTSPS